MQVTIAPSLGQSTVPPLSQGLACLEQSSDSHAYQEPVEQLCRYYRCLATQYVAPTSLAPRQLPNSEQVGSVEHWLLGLRPPTSSLSRCRASLQDVMAQGQAIEALAAAQLTCHEQLLTSSWPLSGKAKRTYDYLVAQLQAYLRHEHNLTLQGARTALQACMSNWHVKATETEVKQVVASSNYSCFLGWLQGDLSWAERLQQQLSQLAANDSTAGGAKREHSLTADMRLHIKYRAQVVHVTTNLQHHQQSWRQKYRHHHYVMLGYGQRRMILQRAIANVTYLLSERRLPIAWRAWGAADDQREQIEPAAKQAFLQSQGRNVATSGSTVSKRIKIRLLHPPG